jgi:transcriptional regulator with XRE-family HTH domain
MTSGCFAKQQSEARVTGAYMPFGEELRRRRIAADLTLAQLARLVFYSTGQLSKVERGIKAASRDLARLCDAALAADGQLVALVSDEAPEAQGDYTDDDGQEVWLMQLPGSAGSWPHPISRRRLVETGVLAIPSAGVARSPARENADDSTLAGMFQSLFSQYRYLGQVVTASALLPALAAQAQSLHELAHVSGPQTRRELLVLAARYAEYTGWLAQEMGQDQAALWWTRRASELATAGGDAQFACYGLVRHALITMYREDGTRTIALARQAQEQTTSPRVRGLAAQREAQGHALVGDYNACMRSLDRAQALLSRHSQQAGHPVIGTTNLPDPAQMVKGWCLYDLGRPRAAAEALDGQLRSVPAGALRAQARYGARRALAYAAAGEIEHACQLASGLLDAEQWLGSATIAQDLRALARTLYRHPKNPSVRALAPRLGTALRTPDH